MVVSHKLVVVVGMPHSLVGCKVDDSLVHASQMELVLFQWLLGAGYFSGKSGFLDPAYFSGKSDFQDPGYLSGKSGFLESGYFSGNFGFL